MAVRAAAAVGLLLWAAPAAAQTVNVEVDVTGGASTEKVRAASTQLRVFGASASDWRFFGELSLGGTWGPESDAFGGAYAYDRKLRPSEAYVEKMFHPGGYLLGLKAGRYRTPFGIYGRGEHGYLGFVRPPLIRYGDRFALSNTYFEGGAEIVAGRPALFVQGSLGIPQDEGEQIRRRELDAIFRVQGYRGSLIVGASHMRSGRDRALGSFAQGRAWFSGVDARWMSSGVELRGEWIVGEAFEGVRTDGGYLDAIVHVPAMGPVTAVARVERIDYDAGPRSFYMRRMTAGGRVRIAKFLSVQLNLVHQPERLDSGRRTAFDAGITCTLRPFSR